MIKYLLDECQIDNRDSECTWIHLPTGDTLELTRDDLKSLLRNMDENKEVECQ